MKSRYLLASAVLLALLTSTASAIDSIKTSKASISGAIEQMGKFEVKIKKTGGASETVQVNEIETIRFDGEPAQLNLVRSAVNGGRYQDAIDTADKISIEGIERLEIKQELEFFKAISLARLALSGNGDANAVNEAGKTMRDFVTKNPGSYHFVEASEALGDLFLAAGAVDRAVEQYATLEQAPWADVKMRGAVAKGRALQASDKNAEALAAYEAALALASGGSGELVEAQKQAATIGKAACLAETGKHDEGIKLLEEVIAKADPEQAQLHALAYNALGNCQRKAKNAKAALMAYLHVDVLYSTYPSAHAEALSNLAELWQEVGNAERSAQAEQVLIERYANSKWAKK